MAYDHLELGCTPSSEQCVQVGSDDYAKWCKLECEAYTTQLKKVYGNPPEDCRFSVRSFPHDFGSYYEVVIEYNDNDPKGFDYAFKLESGLDVWDKEAKKFLKTNGYPFNKIES